MADPTAESGRTEQDRPPVLKSWRRLYTVVLLHLLLLIVLFTIIMKIFD
jgi:hypothetical protein